MNTEAPAMPAAPRQVLVFCASSRSCDPAFHAAAAELGRALARAGDSIVYGGGGVGSMGALAGARRRVRLAMKSLAVQRAAR